MDDADEVVAAAAGAGGGTGGGDEEDEAARVDVETLDDGIQGMSAEDYVRMRMLPYLILYSNRSPRQARQLAAFETIAIGLSAATSLLGALNMTTPVHSATDALPRMHPASHSPKPSDTRQKDRP